MTRPPLWRRVLAGLPGTGKTELQQHADALEAALGAQVAAAYYLREEVEQLRRHAATVERENDQLHETLRRRRKPQPGPVDTVPMVLDLTRPGDPAELLVSAAWDQKPEEWWRK